MAGQEELKDMQGNSPELGFYDYTRSKRCKTLVFQDKQDGFWKARHYVRGEPIHMKLSQLYFGECRRIPDEEIEASIVDYEEKIKYLQKDLEMKKGLEAKTRAEVSA